MLFTQKWIWLSEKEYPTSQTTAHSRFDGKSAGNYTVAEFKKKYCFDKKAVSVRLVFSGDTEFRLFCNNEFVATGPASVGGDFIGNERITPDFYALEKELVLDTKTVDFFAQVKMMPTSIYEYSKGHGGFMLFGMVTFEDGTQTVITTDSSWQARKNEAFKAPCEFDSGIKSPEYTNAVEIDDIWHAEIAPLLPRTEEIINPVEDNRIVLKPHEEKEVVLQLDKIYAGFINISVKTKGSLHAVVNCRELEEKGTKEQLIFAGDCNYRGFKLHSVGNFYVTLKNNSEENSEFTINLISTFYPTNKRAVVSASDGDLNKVLEVCAHTLKICRQLHHLDSPRHCEPLACTGDYYIETLMTMFSFSDMSLSEFDVIRTAKLLRNNDGRMFHTAYSLIWVKMLYDVYMFTGKSKLLEDCYDALILLLKRFETYLGENGLIETPPDYMFIDWICIDGISMHHPPKALGQTCLNMFYYGALDTASLIFAELSQKAMAEDCNERKNKLKNAINTLLFDKEREMYFEGLNTKTADELLGHYMPQNVEKRYYMKHSNILAVYFGVCEKNMEEKLVDKIMNDECPGDVQPYFMHYLLEAVYKSGLRDKYTLKILEKWKKPVLECDKGLVEGFVKPEPTYSFDHSHAWGGTPLYSLPKALLGIEITGKGFSEITLKPSLLGLETATVEFDTPRGRITCRMKAGEKAVVTCPEEIKLSLHEGLQGMVSGPSVLKP